MFNESVDKCSACKYAFACNEQDEINCKDRDYCRFELDSHYIEILGPENKKYYYRRKANKVKFEDLSIEDKFKSLFEDYRRQIQEQVLYDVLVRFYFADWTRKCDYDSMTSEEVVNAAMEVCKKIEENYNYSIDNDIFDNDIFS